MSAIFELGLKGATPKASNVLPDSTHSSSSQVTFVPPSAPQSSLNIMGDHMGELGVDNIKRYVASCLLRGQIAYNPFSLPSKISLPVYFRGKEGRNPSSPPRNTSHLQKYRANSLRSKGSDSLL